MSKSKSFENDLLKLIFNGEAIEGLADNADTAPLTNLFLALHTSDPGEVGTQSTVEVSYVGYSRIAVSRSTSGWTVNGSSVSPAAPIEFGEMTSGATGTATYVSIGVKATGGGKILYRGQLSPAVNYDIGVVPRIRTTSTITED